jgi:hypothetical protein
MPSEKRIEWRAGRVPGIELAGARLNILKRKNRFVFVLQPGIITAWIFELDWTGEDS